MGMEQPSQEGSLNAGPGTIPRTGVFNSPPRNMRLTLTHHCVPQSLQGRWSSLSRRALLFTNQKIAIHFFHKTSNRVGFTVILALIQWSLEKFLTNKALLIPLKNVSNFFQELLY